MRYLTILITSVLVISAIAFYVGFKKGEAEGLNRLINNIITNNILYQLETTGEVRLKANNGVLYLVPKI